MKKQNKYVIGIDLGGTKVEACLMDSQRNVIRRLRRPTETTKGIKKVLANIRGVVEDTAKGQKYDAIGMGTPGTYLKEKDTLFGSPHTPLYETPGFIGKVRELFDVPVTVENDANCLALAEFYETCEGKYKYVMAVIMGTGMGCGLILDNKLFRGAHGGAGEIGHATVDMTGRKCECGRNGCAEAFLSGPSHSRRYEEKTGRKLQLPEIYTLYEQGQKEATDLMNESLMVMAEVCANGVNIFDLEAIILGGGVSKLPIWYQKLPPMTTKKFFGVPRAPVPIIPAKLGDSAGVLGAAYLALKMLKIMTF